MVAEDDKVLVRWSATGTQTGELMGVPPTGKQVRFSGIEAIRVVDDQAVEEWEELDRLGLMTQLWDGITTEIETEIEINASASCVWDILMDFDAFGQWNPFITQISGTPKTGEKLKAVLDETNINPTVLKAESNRELRWLGQFDMPGLFSGEHRFVIEPITTSKIRFIQAEKFRGLLVTFFGSVIAQTKQSFGVMNEALKARAEA
jgi:hypothetical protein